MGIHAGDVRLLKAIPGWKAAERDAAYSRTG